MCQARFPVDIGRLLAKYQIEAWQLIFEVTESNALTNVKQAQITLQHLQELGCQIAIDYFGTGYGKYKTSFDYLMPWVLRYQECSAPLLCECLHRSRIRNDYF